MNTEDSSTDFSLDALLGIQPEVEDQPEPEESRDQPGVPSVDLLSMLGLVPDGGTAREEAASEVAASEPPVADEAFDDLRALLGLGGGPAPASGPAADEPPVAPEAPEAPAPAAPPIRSRFADAPAFRQVEPREKPVAAEEPVVPEAPVAAEEPIVLEESVVPEAPAAAKEPVATKAPAATEKAATSEDPAAVEAPAASEEPRVRDDAPEAPAIPVSPAVRLLAGERSPLGLPECSQARDVTVAREPKSPQPARPVRPEKRPQPAEPPRPSAQQPKPGVANVDVPAAPVAEATAKAKPKPNSKPDPKPAVAPTAPAVADPAPRPAAAPSNPPRAERDLRPPKRSNGIWYLLSACLFALALACTCYVVYAAAHDNASALPAPLVSIAPAEAAEQRFRYTVQSEDGTTRSVAETVRFGVDAFAAESTVSLEAKSESEAASLLEEAKERFGDAWMSGSVEDGKAVFAVKHEDELDRAAYAALLEATTTNCERVE